MAASEMLDFERPIRTRAGSPIQIASVDRSKERPIIGVYWSGDMWITSAWYRSGRFNLKCKVGLDLVNYEEERDSDGFERIE